MSLKSLFISAAFVALAVAPASAGVDDIIKARQACMKSHGATVFGTAMPMIKGEKPFDKAALEAAYVANDAACAGWNDWWGADTMKGEAVKTNALPKVWEDKADFDKDGGEFYGLHQKLRASADLEALKANFGPVAEACKHCHEEFRAPMN